MGWPIEATILEKLRTLSPERVAEVEDFVDFLKSRQDEARSEAAARLRGAMRKLDAIPAPPMSEEAIQAEVDAARRERRKRSIADRR
jgi:hypothetical protein